jgi:ABC-type polysaccharide/polyol phosphate transport system ATPase subunit
MMMNKDIAIKVENLSKTFRIPHENRDTIRERIFNFRRKMTYETFKALDEVSFEILKGEFFGIIGRNGSGKSTLLKILAGIYTPDSGIVQVDGEISPFLELGVGFNPELSGKDNIYLNGTILGLSKKEIEKRYNSIVGFSELERFIHVKLKNYSSGMQVRLAFSVSIHANKDILLMDEVLAVGDTNFQAKCLSEFIKFKEMGKTVVLVTHDTGTVQRYCNRAMLLRNGTIIQTGDPSEAVSAYIYQNMSDEEMRLMEIKAKEENESKEQEKAKNLIPDQKETGAESQSNILPSDKEPEKARITKLCFYNDSGEIRNVFKTGDDLRVRVYFEVLDQNISKLNFGLELFSQENLYVIGINTIIDKVDTNKYIAQGFFEVNYSKIQLNANLYYFKVGIFEENDQKIIDFLHKSDEFRVVTNSLNQGAFQLFYHWE